MTTTKDMQKSRLVQRLTRPSEGSGPAGPFAFGGGLKNGGLSDEALEALTGLFRFDYMGAAEFEFGAVPEALGRLALAGMRRELSAGRFEIELSDVQPHWGAIPKGASWDAKKHWKEPGSAAVWFICPGGWEDEVEARVRAWAGSRGNSDLKCGTGLAASLRPHTEFELESREAGHDVRGWLELDNGFMFFTDHDMWARTCLLFTGGKAEVQ